MAYENGNNIENYIGECLEKYKIDNNIFDKAIKMIEFYMRRVDWPNCIEELENKASKILGVPIIELTFGVSKYIDDKYMNWEVAGDMFKSDFSYFYDTVGELYNMHWMGRFAPYEFYGISYSIGFENIYNLRLSRNDGNSIDFRMKIEDIKYLRNRLDDIIMLGDNDGAEE